MNDIDIDVNVTAWKIGPVTVIALSCDGAIRKCMRRVAMMCARHSACERLDRQEARG